MRAKIVTGCSGIGLAAVSFALPVVFPHVDPWVAKVVLGAGILLIFIAFVLWVSSLGGRASESGATQTTYGPQSPAIGSVAGDVHLYAQSHPVAVNEPAAPPTQSQRRDQRQPDLPFTGVLVRLYKKKGGMPEEEGKKQEFLRSINLELGDQTHQKRMAVWGRIHNLPIDRISPYSLQYGAFDHRNKQFTATGLHAVRSTVWTDLKFCKAEVDEVWPDD